MRKTELQRFRKKLLEEKERVTQSLAQHEKVISNVDGAEYGGPGKAHSNHLADQGTDEFQYEATIQFASTEGRYLYHIEEALRAHRGRDLRRVRGLRRGDRPRAAEALPYARLCIECKEKEEAESA